MRPQSSRPRRAAAALLLAVLAPAAAGAVEGAPEAASVVVSVDNAKVIRLPERTATVVVGNPIIADVSLQKNGIVILTGKSFGSTNLIALDAQGGMLAESSIMVQGSTSSMVTVQRGLDRESYSCTPACQPAVALGDAQRYFSEVSGQAGQRTSLATQK
jgi:Flp pilus assembly secretin CpaC